MPFRPPKGTELVAVLGAGSTFEVGLVREGEHELVCKRLRPGLHGEPLARAALVREAQALAAAAHPALPALVRVGSDAAGPFVLQTRIEGISARRLLEGWRARGRNVPESLARHVAHAALEALATLHELEALELVHGDLTPDHLLVGPLGDVRLVDLGAARWRGMDPSLGGEDRGTLPYASPELARGEVPPDAGADVYALAATVLLLASGGPLTHARDEAAMLLEIAEGGVRRELVDEARGFSASEREALRAALSPFPEDRPRSARALLQALGGTRG